MKRGAASAVVRRSPAASLAAVLFVVLVLVHGATLAAVERMAPSTPGLQADPPLQALISQRLVEEGLVGASWSLVLPDLGVTVGAAGLRDLAPPRPMAPDTRVQVGSVAKTLLAAGVLRLVTKQQIDLDAPLARYLPDAPIVNPWQATAPLTVRHLLDHSSGLDDARLWQVFSLQSSADAPLLAGLVRPGQSLRVRHPPGERTSYSNTGYLLLGMVVEAVTGVRYESWLDAELLAPLGMTRSTFRFVTQTGGGADPSLAMGHFDATTPSPSVPIPVRPASQFTTTAADMGRFAQFLMSDGELLGQPFISAELLRAMGVPKTTQAARAGLRAGLALGLSRRDRHGAVGLCHLGNVGNFRAALCLYPEDNRAFFVAYNADPETARFDRIDGLLVQALGLPEATAPPATQADSPATDTKAWHGLYRVQPNRFEQFRYLDDLAGITRVSGSAKGLRWQPLQGSERELLPAGGQLFRATDRVEPSHVQISSPQGQHLISDGLRTYVQVPLPMVMLQWTSAAAGALSLLYLLLWGGARSVAAARRGAVMSEPLIWVAACLLMLLTAPLLYLAQPALALGDPTLANGAMALLSGLLPAALLLSGVQRWRAGLATWASRFDFAALILGLQWCGVLAAAGLLPLVLWR